MACGSCSKHRTSRNINTPVDYNYNLTGGLDISSLNQQQIRARLEVYKRKFCTGCGKRYDCDYASYVVCKTSKKG